MFFLLDLVNPEHIATEILALHLVAAEGVLTIGHKLSQRNVKTVPIPIRNLHIKFESHSIKRPGK